jgi:putative MATE family efflux protein
MNPVTPSELAARSPAATARTGGADGLSRADVAAASDGRAADIAKARMLTRREALLNGPILPTMLRLAIPTVVVLVVQTLVGVAETYFVGFLGTDALAGVALVFPVLMLMQMMSNGGVGGGVASAVSRALGAGRKDEADALVLNALVLAVVFGAVFSAAEFLGGRALYRALGGQGATLAASLAYADTVFAGATLVWIVSLLAAALRGAGNTVVPAVVIFIGIFVLLPLSPMLIFGWGPFPRLGVAGAGLAVVAYYLVGAAVLIGYLRSGRGTLRLAFDVSRIERRLLADILRVGGLSAVGTIQANLTVILVTGIVGLFGTGAIAGYGIASRLDYILIPLLFALGTAALTMVGTNFGAGQVARAERIAWIGAFFAAGMTELIGVTAAIFPRAWLSLFSTEPTVLATGELYLHVVAPFYGIFGFGMLLYFAGQGAGRVLWPVLAGTARLIVAALVGWIIVVHFGGGLRALFITVAIASISYGTITAMALRLRGWDRDVRGAGLAEVPKLQSRK